MNNSRFYNIKIDGFSHGIFAGESPADAALEMSADAAPGDVHRFLAEILEQADHPDFKRGYSLGAGGYYSAPNTLADAFVALPNVEAEDISTWTIEHLDLLAREKKYSGWSDFLHMSASKSGFWTSKSLAKEMLASQCAHV